jgi:hypothetical protein
MFNVVCWKWKPLRDYRSRHDASHVNALYNMVQRNYKSPHQFTCITDDWAGLDSGIRVIPPSFVPKWKELAALPSPHGGLNPTCYRRLPMYGADASEWLAERFVSLDLDVVIVRDVTPVWDRKEEFVIWGETLRTTPYNGSMQMMTAGARRQIWDDFDPATSPQKAMNAGYHGSDQAWISYKLGPHESRWTKKDGVFSFRMDIKPHAGKLPETARIVFFEGHIDPWSPTALQMCDWIPLHYK